MQVEVKQDSGVRFSIHARGHIVLSDQPTENGGADGGMTPPELLLGSLGSCAAYYAVQFLKLRGLTDEGVNVTVDAEKLKAPARMGNFRVRVTSPVPLSEEQRRGLERTVHQCMVQNTLLSAPQITLELTVPQVHTVGQ